MGVVLRKATGAGETVDNTRFLVAVDGAELEHTNRKFTVAATTRCENEIVHRAVHRLDVVVLRSLGAVAMFVIFAVELHWREHAIRVEVQVTGLLEQVALGYVRGVHKVIARFDMTATGMLLHLVADDAALDMEYRETRTNLIWEAEQIQLGAQTAVIALLSLEHTVKVLV